MPERQPGRPTERKFTEAAVRFLKDDYKIKRLFVSTSVYTNVYNVPSEKPADIAIITSELEAEGLPGESESLSDFAIRQLSMYQKSRKR